MSWYLNEFEPKQESPIMKTTYLSGVYAILSAMYSDLERLP